MTSTSKWSCSSCTFENANETENCFMCGGDRKGAVAFDLLGYLTGLMLCVHTVPGDGHCFYHTIVRSGLASDVRHLRGMVAGYLEAFQAETEATLTGKSFSEFISGVRCSAHADNPEIVSVCELLGIEIFIHRTNSKNVTHIHPKSNRSNDARIVHILYNGCHYDLLVPIEEEQNDTPREDTTNDAVIARFVREEEMLKHDERLARTLSSL